MELSEAMKQRHSVRQYTDKPVEAEALHALQEEIKACRNRKQS